MSITSQDINVEGRIIMGHPLVRLPKTDQHERPVMMADNVTPVTQVFFALAVPKGGESHWNQTVWGQVIHNIGYTAYKDMTARPDFSWKVEDGDSVVPNKKGRKNCDSEGHAGHWVLKCSTQLDVPVYPVGKYGPFDVIRDKNAIHTGDYFMVSINVADNTDKNGQPAQSPGVYLNPRGCVYLRAGERIVGENQFDAQSVFGAMNLQGQQPPVQQPPVQQPPVQQPPVQQPPVQQPPVQPAHDLVQPGAAITPPPLPQVEPKYNVSGTVYTKSQLVGFGYTDTHFATMTAI